MVRLGRYVLGAREIYERASAAHNFGPSLDFKLQDGQCAGRELVFQLTQEFALFV